MNILSLLFVMATNYFKLCSDFDNYKIISLTDSFLSSPKSSNNEAYDLKNWNNW